MYGQNFSLPDLLSNEIRLFMGVTLGRNKIIFHARKITRILTVLQESFVFSFSDTLLLSSYCLDGKIEEMFNLWTMIFEDLHLNDSHRLVCTFY